MVLTAAPRNQRMKDALNINAIGLHAPRPAVDLQARRLHDMARDAASLKKPRQPEAVIARLIAQRHFRNLTRDLGHAVPCRIQLGHQSFSVAAPDRMQAWIIPLRRLDRQEPAVLAQLQGSMNMLFVGGGY